MDKEQLKMLLKENLSVSVSKNRKTTTPFWDLSISFDGEEILKVWVKEDYKTKHT